MRMLFLVYGMTVLLGTTMYTFKTYADGSSGRSSSSSSRGWGGGGSGWSSGGGHK